MRTRLSLRIISLVLAMLLLLQIGVLATPATEPETPLTAELPVDPDQDVPPETPVEPMPETVTPEQLGITIPGGWSHNALYFAVVNGILAGDKEGNLNAADPATRAEMAAILTRMVGVADTHHNLSIAGADLSQYKDMPEKAWYVPYLSAAVRLGIFNGVSDTTLAPLSNITREQAFTVIGRTFGLQGGTRDDLAKFGDGASVSNYAVTYMGALAKAGYINGNKGGNITPQDNISRQELAQVLYNLFSKKGDIVNHTSQLSDKGNVLYNTSWPMPAGTTVNGNLILTAKVGQDIKLENVTVNGTVTVIMQDKSSVTATGCTAQNVVLLSQTAVTFDGAIDRLSMTGADGAAYYGTANSATISSDAILGGTFGSVSTTGDALTTSPGSHVDSLSVKTAGATVTADGTIGFAELRARKQTLQGGGKANEVLYHYADNTITLAHDKLTADLDKGVEGAQLTLSTGHKVNANNTNLKITATVSKLPGGYGSDSGRPCIVQWYVGDTLTQTNNVMVKEGTVLTFNHKYVINSGSPASFNVKAVLTHYDQQISGTTSVAVDKTVNIPQINGRIAPGDYSTYEKEVFVNTKGYSSNSRYLVWINLYHTKVNVFEGSRGNWELIKAFSCGIGAAATPTPPGIYRMQSHEPYNRWSYGSWYVDNISRWNGGYAFHTRARQTSNGAMFTNDINVMVSHGCIRMNIDEARWMFNVPIGSTVVVY